MVPHVSKDLEEVIVKFTGDNRWLTGYIIP